MNENEFPSNDNEEKDDSEIESPSESDSDYIDCSLDSLSSNEEKRPNVSGGANKEIEYKSLTQRKVESQCNNSNNSITDLKLSYMRRGRKKSITFDSQSDTIFDITKKEELITINKGNVRNFTVNCDDHDNRKVSIIDFNNSNESKMRMSTTIKTSRENKELGKEDEDDNTIDDEEDYLDEIDGLMLEDDDNSFLKQMIIETNKHYLKDQKHTEDVLKNTAMRIILIIICQKQKYNWLLCLLKIQSFKNDTKRDSECVYNDNKRNEKDYRENINGIILCSKAQRLPAIPLFQNIIQLLSKDEFTQTELNNEEGKTHNNNIITVNTPPCIPVRPNSQTIPLISTTNSSEPTVQTLPSIPNIPPVPGIPPVPLIPTIPPVPGIPPVPLIPSIPPVPEISCVPNIPLIPGVPPVPSIPSIPSVPIIPTIPNIPLIGIPLINNTLNQNPDDNSPHPMLNINIRRLQWTPIDKSKYLSSFWHNNPSSIPINYNLLQSAFTENKLGKLAPPQVIPPNTKMPLIKILEDKRIMNLTISLSKLPFKLREIEELILTYDKEEQINKDLLEKLIFLYPTKQEIEAFSSFKGDKSLFTLPENFCMMMINIPNSQTILSLLLFNSSLNTDYKDILIKLSTYSECFSSISSSDKFKQILFMIRRIGNYLNYKTPKGNAYGFLLSSLKMLENLKGYSLNKMNLIEFIIENIKEFNNSLNTFHKDFSKIDESLQIDAFELDQSIKGIETGIEKIKKQKEELLNKVNNANNNDYSMFLDRILANATKKLNEINIQYKTYQQNLNEMIEMFAEDKSKFKILDFIKNIHDFIESFKNKLLQISQNEARLLKKQLNEEKKRNNVHNANNNKIIKELQIIGQTARKTMSRKSAIHNKNDLKAIKEEENKKSPYKNNKHLIRITNFKGLNNNNNKENKIEDDDYTIANEYIMINHPIKMNEIQSMSILTKKY